MIGIRGSLVHAKNWTKSGVSELLKYFEFKLLEVIGSADVPFEIQMDITNACNLSCVHCYHPHHKNIGALNYSNWLQVLDQYEELLTALRRRPSFIFCGGEPLLSPHLHSLMIEIRKRFGDARIALLTNGTRIDDQWLEILVEQNVSVQVSIDGPESTSHDSARGLGTFEKSIRGIEKMIRRNLKVSLLTVLSKRTAPLIPKFFKLAQAIGVNDMNFTRLIPTGRGELLTRSMEDSPLNSNELKQAYEKIIQCSMESGIRTNTRQPLFQLLDSRLGYNDQFGFHGVVVDYLGNMKISSRTPTVIGNLFRDGSMKELFLENKLMKKLRTKSNYECGKCEHFSKCGGSRNAAWAATGSYFAKDPSCWLLFASR